MKKRWIILISNILSVMLILICLSGCKWLFGDGMREGDDPWEYKQQEGEFYYYVRHGSATILGLVDEELEIEELVIPETLGGYPVKQVGAFQESGFLGRAAYEYGMNCKNVSRIKIIHDVVLTNCAFKLFSGEIILDAAVSFSNGKDLSKRMGNDVQVIYSTLNGRGEPQLASTFMKSGNGFVNYSPEGGEIRFRNIIVGAGKQAIEQLPEREGYIFAGWYTEKEYINQWNFEEDMVEQNTIITLYAKWIEA